MLITIAQKGSRTNRRYAMDLFFLTAGMQQGSCPIRSLQDLLRHGPGEVFGGIVAVVFPVHRAQEAVLDNVVALFSDGTDIVEAEDEPAFRVGVIGDAGILVPNFLVTFQRRPQGFVIDLVIVSFLPMPIERHAHHQLVGGDAGGEVDFNGSIGGHPSGDAAAGVQRGVVSRGTSHVI